MVATWATGSPGSSAAGETLVGRAEDLARLRDLVDDDAVHLVTVTGQVGVGKSSLVAELVRGSRHEPWLTVSLAGVSGAPLVDDALITALREPDSHPATAAEALWGRASGAEVRLWLDDADEAEGLAERVLDLLEAYPLLTIVVTRLKPLRAVGEHVLPLKPLRAAGDTGDSPAVRMFAQRAAAADAGFVLDDVTRPAVEQLCLTVDGLPLAIEIAAARVSAVPPAEMAKQIGRSLSVLHQRERVGVPERHLSVEAALQWSMDLLDPEARATLAQVAVFEGPFTLSAAQHVTAPRRPEPELLDSLSALVDSHFVDLERADGSEVSFRLQPLVRHHALAVLHAMGDEKRARDAHADYWVGLCRADAATPARHWADVLAALDRRVASGRLDEALQLAIMATPVIADSPGAQESLLPLVESVLGDGRVSDEALVARTLMWATVHSPGERQGNAAYGAWMARRLRRSIDLARSAGDDAALLEALELVVTTLGITFDLEGAIASAHEGLALAERSGDEAATARFEVWTAMAQSVTGELDRFARSARSAYTRGLRAGDDVAVVHSALMLHQLPPGEQGSVPLLDLEDLLRRADALNKPLLVLHVLGGIVLRDLDTDESSVLDAMGRMLLIADGAERTWPMATVGGLILLAIVAARRGAIEDVVRIRESLAGLEHLLPNIVPTLAPAYAAVVGPLRDAVAPARYEELAAEVRGMTLAQANRRAQAMLRSYQPARERRTVVDLEEPRIEAGTLTPRERDVLGQLVRGGTNRDVAEALGMTTKTVMHHTVAIYRKLGVRGRAEAVAWAMRTGAVTVD